MNRKALLVPFNQKQEIYIQDRTGHKPPPWGFFGGGIEEGETPLEAVIRETKEELDIDVVENDLIFLGTFTHLFGEDMVERNLFLYRTEQEVFTVLEGAGGYWMDYEMAEKYLDIDERFEKIWGMIQKNV